MNLQHESRYDGAHFNAKIALERLPCWRSFGHLPRCIETEAVHLREAPDRDANVQIY